MTIYSLDELLFLFGTSLLFHVQFFFFFFSSSNYCFLTCIQISQEADQVVWYSHLFQNFPRFVVIHTVKGFGIVSKPEINVFLNSLAFSMNQQMLAIWFLVPLPFLKPASTSGSSWFPYCWSLAWRILRINFTSMWEEYSCVVVWAFFGIAFLWDWNENWAFPVLWPLLSFPDLLAELSTPLHILLSALRVVFSQYIS